jgi:hypothetical protein
MLWANAGQTDGAMINGLNSTAQLSLYSQFILVLNRLFSKIGTIGLSLLAPLSLYSQFILVPDRLFSKIVTIGT